MGNTGKEGLHLACLGETWQTLAFGFAGLRLGPDGPELRPALPRGWKALRFRFLYRGKSWRAEIKADAPPGAERRLKIPARSWPRGDLQISSPSATRNFSSARFSMRDT